MLEINDLKAWMIENFGIEMTYRCEQKYFLEWLEYKVGKGRTLQLSLSAYMTNDELNGKQFISYDLSTSTGGKGLPIDSFEELMEQLDADGIHPVARQESLF